MTDGQGTFLLAPSLFLEAKSLSDYHSVGKSVDFILACGGEVFQLPVSSPCSSWTDSSSSVPELCPLPNVL